MMRPEKFKQSRIVKVERDGMPTKRERLVLDCGHVMERAIRAERPARVYCLDCNPEAASQ